MIQCCAHGLRFNLNTGYLLGSTQLRVNRYPVERAGDDQLHIVVAPEGRTSHARVEPRRHRSRPRVRDTGPGMAVSLVAAAAATFLSEHYGALCCCLPCCSAWPELPQRRGELQGGDRVHGPQRAAHRVALLGMRITLGQIAELGWMPVVLVVTLVVVTIGLSVVVAKWMGFQRLFGMLTGGATAICGASAALARPPPCPIIPVKERATLFTVIGSRYTRRWR